MKLKIQPAAKMQFCNFLTSSRMSAYGHRPICQDTGIVTVFLRQGMGLRWKTDLTIEKNGE